MWPWSTVKHICRESTSEQITHRTASETVLTKIKAWMWWGQTSLRYLSSCTYDTGSRSSLWLDDSPPKLKWSCRPVKSHTCHQICWQMTDYNCFPTNQQYVFDSHDVETHKSLHLSSECVSCLIGELTSCVISKLALNHDSHYTWTRAHFSVSSYTAVHMHFNHLKAPFTLEIYLN